ncbi:30S ribosomal protein S17 [Wolbachia endosymbiont of Pentalonia nigronervosa]|uniref:30S ribosomal protein S17 n=1 Tax=Wolbachia endosymbiont of Pentalonia nigronervosa TaxID=1301914 RepID=UPI00165EC7E8|nr:30S ribosomal protein S17 [Wolbachia endosymbiont of Pentalonia nigronervosa]MBD0391283.1 30S ribosomal protein S17 [Wolbachia endosymbiont of Pentalonia nigronervosa]
MKEEERKRMPKKVFCGTVINAKCEKTIKVSVLQVYKDKLYKKVIKKYKKYTVHDESNSCKEGDKVFIQEHMPISATKKWIVINHSS